MRAEQTQNAQMKLINWKSETPGSDWFEDKK